VVELVQVFQGVTACINTTWGLLPVSVELMGLNPYESDPVLSLDVLFDVGVRVKCFLLNSQKVTVPMLIVQSMYQVAYEYTLCSQEMWFFERMHRLFHFSQRNSSY